MSQVSLNCFRTSYLDVLKAIHSIGITHGDLRLENMLLNSRGSVAIIDFTHATVNAARSGLEAENRIFVDLLDDIVRLPRQVTLLPSKVQPTSEFQRVTRLMGSQRYGSSGMILRARRQLDHAAHQL